MPKNQQKPALEKSLTKSENKFPVVGVGASAGGLDAFKELLKSIPEKSGMAYVLVQHLAPSHESLLPELLQKVTKIPVSEIKDDVKVEPDHIYVIPSNKLLLSNDGKLELSPRPKPKTNMLHLPINLFFTSLAEVHQAHSIGVVLSGTGSDGTLGLKAIKDHGGITFAQDEASSEYEGMPDSAAQAGVVDFILPPNKIPQKLLEINKITNGKDSKKDDVPPKDAEVFMQILSLLHVRKGTDFTHYKQTTIRRRILRRMALNKKKSPASYLDYLRSHKKEQDVLYQDMLIPVTEFFRDKKIFDHLCEKVFPKIVENKEKRDTIRIWCAGCSTGQEAYSIAMCFKEFLEGYTSVPTNEKIQIFATDISEASIEKARKAEYSKNEVEGVGPLRLKKFFEKTNAHYQVKKEIRKLCVFAEHNFLKDPPFGKMDFISCRNVLIYMEPYLQKKAFTTFHYALGSASNGSREKKGFLLLGKSEGGNAVLDFFAPVDKKGKLFERKNVPGRFMHVIGQYSPEAHNRGKKQEKKPFEMYSDLKNEQQQTDFQKTADALLLKKYTPAGVVVNDAMDIVYFHGRTGNYLEQQAGKPNHNLYKMAKNGLGFELRPILHNAKKKGSSVRKEKISMEINGNSAPISIEAVPLPHLAEPHYLILFQPMTDSDRPFDGQTQTINKHKQVKEEPTEGEKDRRINQLENELSQVREDMRGISEEQEAVNEELQSANEELMSGNEELQSLNEELETSREELQSANEELTVVNQELVGLNDQLTNSRNYAEAIVETIREPLLVLDNNLRVVSANKNFYKTFKVREEETTGNLVYRMGNKQWDIPKLKHLLDTVVSEKESFNDFEVIQDFDVIGKRTMLLNARQISNGSIDENLILLAIEDVTETKKTEIKDARLSAIVESSEDAIIGKNLEGIITSWNNGAERIFGHNSKETIGKHISIILPPGLKQEEEMIINTIKGGGQLSLFESVRITKDGKKVPISLTGSPIKDTKGKIIGVSEISRDITGRKQMEEALRESEERFREMINALPAAVYTTDAEGLITHYNPAAVEFAGRTPELGADHWCVTWKLHNPDGTPLPHNECPMAVALREGCPIHGREAIAERPDGTKRWFIPFPTPLRDAEGRLIGAINMLVDITERKQSELTNALLSSVVNGSDDAIISKKLDGTITSWNKGAEKIFGYPPKEAIGRNIRLIIPPERKKEEDTIIEKIKKGKVVDHFETVRLTKDGKRIPLSLTISPVKDNKGKIIGASKIARDITEQKKAISKIQESESHFRQMADLMPGKILNTDEEGNAYYFNRHWMDDTGKSHEKLEGRGWQKTIHPDDFETFINAWKDSLKSGKVFEMEFRCMNKNGEYKWQLGRAVPVKNEAGKIKTWINSAVEIQKLKDEEKRKEDFLKMASHELKTPVTSIKGYVQLLLGMLKQGKDVSLSAVPLKPSLERIDHQITRLTRLIAEMLDLSRVEENRLELKKETLSLNDLVKETINDINFTNTQCNIKLFHNFHAQVNADRDRLGQVLINFITNAIKYSPENKDVEVCIYKKKEGQVAVSVKDHGIGIDQKDQKNIFNRFYRVGGKSQETYSGFGIGLYLAHEIIERHKGSIDVESELGKGSTFTFMLPCGG